MNKEVRYFTKARNSGQVGSCLISREDKDRYFSGKQNPDNTDPNFIIWWEEVEEVEGVEEVEE